MRIESRQSHRVAVSSQWAHDDQYFRFPRTSGLPRNTFARPRRRFPWRSAGLIFAVIAFVVIERLTAFFPPT